MLLVRRPPAADGIAGGAPSADPIRSRFSAATKLDDDSLGEKTDESHTTGSVPAGSETLNETLALSSVVVVGTTPSVAARRRRAGVSYGHPRVCEAAWEADGDPAADADGDPAADRDGLAADADGDPTVDGEAAADGDGDAQEIV